MKCTQLAAVAAEKLKKAGIHPAENEARWIVAESAAIPMVRWAMDVEIPADAEMLIRQRIERRCTGEPLQYILGTAPFRNLMLEVTPAVLIPRPETETLIEWVIRRLPRNGRILDLGTGSGAIALAVVEERPDAVATAVDLSADALNVARRNAERTNLASRVTFLQSDLFSALGNAKFDLVAANLPYVTEEEYVSLNREVRDFEPKMALTAPDAGLALINRTIDELRTHLVPGGKAIFELDPAQAAKTAGRLAAHGFQTGIVRDLCERDRFVYGELQ